MAIMKQIDKCLVDAFAGKKPAPSSKWKAIILRKNHDYKLFVFHYQHTVLVFNINEWSSFYEWWEKPADRRGLESCLEWLRENERNKEITGKLPC